MARFNLPDIDFVDDTPEELETLAVSKFESLMGGTITLDEADPRRKFIQAIAYVATIIQNNIDFTGKQSLLSYAVDYYLDHIGNTQKIPVPRLAADYAMTTVHFEMNALTEFLIEAGTQMSVNGLYFATKEDVLVAQGTTELDIEFTCETAGEVGNGLLPGQITELVEPDKFPWVNKAYNITTSSGGAEIEADDAYAERIRIAPEGYSCAGPSGAYEYYAKTASQRIIDVKARQITPGVVGIYPLMEGGTLSTPEEKNAILEVCNEKHVRPLTDKVQVLDPETVFYDLSVTYYIADKSQEDAIQQNVDAARADYINWQKTKLGRGIDPSELYARLQKAGAKRIIVTPNDYIKLEEYQVAKEGTISLSYRGIIYD